MLRVPVRSLAALAAAVAFAALGAVPAVADVIPDAADEAGHVLALEARLEGASQTELARLSARDLELLNKYAKPVSETRISTLHRVDASDPSVAALATATGSAATALCYTATSSRTAKGIAGNDLYRSWHVGKWCRSATTVISASRVEQGWQTYWLGWSGKGLIGGAAGVVSNQGRSYSQHSFQYQLGSPYPTQYTQPCTRIRGTATPGYYADFVCGLYS
jgi:hypothetical protein